ncbi:MAG: SGNH/GDSL hydrolase family protein [Candidatus Omnitrophica bacterium]|nr:SGNH/GDSL hydrolase family protein [Candidatus Omnitrophota bacterium]
MKEWVQRIFLVLISILFCFLFLEFIFKTLAWLQPSQAGPTPIAGLPYENTPDARFWRYDPEAGLNYYEHNSFGMRGSATTFEKPPGIFRIAFIGDSVAHGGNVSQGQTTADYLGLFLGDRQDGRKYEVLNFGVASFGLREYSILLEKKAFLFSPDLVLVGLCLNDYYIRGAEDLKMEDKNDPRGRLRERYANLFKSHFLEYLRDIVPSLNPRYTFGGSEKVEDQATRKLGALKGITDGKKKALRDFSRQKHLPLASFMKLVVNYIPEYRNPEAWIKNEAYIQSIIRACEARKVPVYFFVYPLNEQIFPGFDDPMPQPFIQKLVERNGGQYVEVLRNVKDYQQSNSRQKLYTRLDHMHLLSAGHRLIARLLAEALERG